MYLDSASGLFDFQLGKDIADALLRWNRSRSRIRIYPGAGKLSSASAAKGKKEGCRYYKHHSDDH